MRKKLSQNILNFFLVLLLAFSSIHPLSFTIKAQNSQINVDSIEDKDALLSFLSWFYNWNAGRPSGNKEIYDAGYVQDPSMNILANIVSCPGCFNFKDHPELRQPQYKVGKDPKGWGTSGEYYVFDGPAADFVAEQIFNVSKEDLKALLAAGEEKRLIYRNETENSYQYISPNASGIGGVLPHARLLSASQIENRLAIVFHMVYPPVTGLADIGPFYAQVEYKKLEGKGYWSLYRYMKGTTSWPGYQNFRDIDTKSWSFPGIQYVVDHKIMTGFNPIRFAPEAMTSRAMVATILYRMENEPQSQTSPFSDVKKEDYFYRAAGWAYENGLMTGYESGKFGAADPISREQMAAVLYRYARWKELDLSYNDSLNSFPDLNLVSPYAIESMKWAVSKGLIKGVDGKVLKPQDGCSRAQTAAVLERFSRIN